MKTVTELAAEKGVRSTAVSNHLKRYQKELKGHIVQQGRRKFLDDFAIEFLSEKINGSQIVIYDAQKDEEIQQLQTENKQLYQQLVTIQGDHVKAQEQLQEQRDRVHALEVEKLRIEGAQEQAEEKIKNLESAAEQAGAELEQAQAERNRANEKMERLQTRRLTIRERLTGRLQSVDAE